MFEYIFIGLVLSLSFFVVVDDIRHKKIKNKFIILGASLGLVLFLAFWFSGNISVAYLKDVLINSGIALVVSFALWKWGIWPAGDAKLFALFSFLLPLEFYSKSYLAYFPAFSFLVNSFMLLLYFIFLKSILFFIQDFISESGKRGFMKNMSSILKDKRGKFRERIHDKKRLFKDFSRFILILTLYILIVKFYLHFSFGTVSFIWHSGFFALIFMLFEFYTDNFSLEVVPIAELAEKMNLTEKTIEEIKSISETFTRLGVLRPEGLDKKQVEIIQKYAQERGIKELCVYQTIPFSPWIIGGLLATLIFHSNILNLF